jgi:uncharacterized protein (DUF305 family)
VEPARWWVALVVLVAGCAAPPPRPGGPAPPADQADVWFVQHMVPHLRQTTAIALLTRDRVTDPALGRLADSIRRRSQADADRLQGWLDRRGLAPHGHSHQRVDQRRRSDLERLSRHRGAAFDRAFVQVMAARHRAGIQMAALQRHRGTVPEVRRMAEQLLAERRGQLRRLQAWMRWASR